VGSQARHCFEHCGSFQHDHAVATPRPGATMEDSLSQRTSSFLSFTVLRSSAPTHDDYVRRPLNHRKIQDSEQMVLLVRQGFIHEHGRRHSAKSTIICDRLGARRSCEWLLDMCAVVLKARLHSERSQHECVTSEHVIVG
jgi:hypothetical protein